LSCPSRSSKSSLKELKLHACTENGYPPGMIKLFRSFALAMTVLFLTAAPSQAVEKSPPAPNVGCLSCHTGIERFTDGPMMDAIESAGDEFGDPAGCITCHGGNPKETKDKAKAHTGAPAGLTKAGGPALFYPDPGAITIADKTCGQCHEGYPERLQKSLMNTEAGKLQGNMWSWGLQKDMKTVYGNYDLVDKDGNVPSVGTDAYKEYMVAYSTSHPDQMPSSIKQIPEVDVNAISDHPNQAGITYSRQQCQRCHVGVQGREKRGDFRGNGCSACHVPYSNDGFYEGGDPTIDKTQAGRPLIHRMQAGRKSVVKHNGISYTGIPTETCTTCHNRGKRVGMSYQGVMEFPYGSPVNAEGKKQPKLHTKKYTFIADDLHHQQDSRPGNPKGGLLCQDCHTSIDMHGDGNIPGTTLAQVEIECEDCHGTPKKFPWELPLGTGEEFGKPLKEAARGLASDLPAFMYMSDVPDEKDGFLITTRGNPLGNVVKDGKKVMLHSASGLDFEVPVLKQIGQDKTFSSPESKTAMYDLSKHGESMECYACHADWAPQCYGCHVTVDYSKGKTDVDWITNANARGEDGLTADAPLGTNGLTSAGKVSETRSYLRWETPILGINGEGRVSPLMPGCQVITTVIDKDGKTVAKNEIWHTPEGKGLDHAAVQPHTSSRKGRSCESCHDNPKTLGYGIEGGRFMGNAKDMVLDLETATGQIIPGKTSVQSPAIPKLDHDLSQIVTRDGKQLVSIGSHWPLTGPLPQDMRDRMERTGLCIGCHEEQSDAKFWDKVSTDGWLNNADHKKAMKKMLKAYAKTSKK